MTLPASLRPLLPPVLLPRLIIIFFTIFLAWWTQWVPKSGEWNFANEWLRDRCVRLHANAAQDPRILVVDIEESSLAEAGPWPWPRARLAALLENLIQAGAKGVAFDIFLPEEADPAGDQRLENLAQYGPLVLAQALDYGEQPLPLRIGYLTGAMAAPPTLPAVEANGYIANHAGFRQAAHMGNIGFVPDPDGTLRRLPLLTRFQGKVYPTASLALLACCSGAKLPAPPHDAEGFLRVPFSHELQSFKGMRAADALGADLSAEDVKGRFVLVGSSALGLVDRVPTPLDAKTPGLLVHAEALSALLDEQQGTAPALWPGRWIGLLYAAAVAMFAGFGFARLSALASIASLAALSLGWVGLAYWVFPHDPGFSVTGPLACNLFLLAVAVPFDWQIAQRRSRKLLGTLRQYLARAVVDELLRSDLKDPLAPRQLWVTTLIADMEGYTTQVESLTIEEAAQITRDFLDCLTRPVLDKQGTLDKYTGDGLVAFWGAPLPNADHANLALDAAQAMVAEVKRFSEARRQAGKPAVRVRIGVESGLAMAGDFGTSFRSIYTAVGDSVNVASRLEESARDFSHCVIVGPGTVALATRHGFTSLGQRMLRGKENPTALYGLDGSA